MRCPKCLLCLSALLTLLGLKVYIEWTSEPRLGKAYPGPRSTLLGPTPASTEPTLPANLSARLGQTGPLPLAYWNQQQWRLGTLPGVNSTEAGDCGAWGAAAAAEIPDFASYPEDLRRFLLWAACRSFPPWLPTGGGGQVTGCEDPGDVPFLLLAVKSEPGRCGTTGREGDLGQAMRCPKCLLCLSALLTLLGLKVYIEWTSEPRLGKAYPGPRSTLLGPTPASTEPTLPANLSARLGQTGPLPLAYWNQQQWRLGTLPGVNSTEAGDCGAWGAAAAAEIPDFASYPEDLRRFLLWAACRSFPPWLPTGGGGQVTGCEDPGDVPFLLLAVKSEPGRFAERQAVRETWGRPAPGVRLLFLLGSPVGQAGPDLGTLVSWESRRYGDLLLWDFLDVPFNQTLKDLMLLAWLGRHCPSVSFVLQAQDDAFVRTPALLDHLRGLPPVRARGLYLGEVFIQAKPLRKPGGPFYVPGSFFEGSYPAYASGGGYVIAGRLAPWLLQAAARVAPFPFGDVYTGLCFQALGLAPRTHKGFLTAWPADRTADPCAFRDLLLVRPLSPQDSIRLWKQLQDPGLQCRAPEAEAGRGGQGSP
uniref:UDP-GlcNAc:betaGal beta-1,3-N-acetylglucosaminyltransferase 8 n=1 Tax=Bos mutus grunniens TaxID=30521 RepID=A0A8B9Y0Z6_BOSMU